MTNSIQRPTFRIKGSYYIFNDHFSQPGREKAFPKTGLLTWYYDNVRTRTVCQGRHSYLAYSAVLNYRHGCFFERLFSLRAAQDREGVAVTILQLLEYGRFSDARDVLAARRKHRKRKGSSAEFVLQEAIAVQGSEQEVLEIVLAHTVEREA